MYKVYCDNYLIFDTKRDDLRIFNAKVDLELNKTGSFEFTIYPSNPNYNRLEKLKSTIQVFQDSNLLFRGRILNDEQGFHNEKKVSCEGELSFLLDSIQRPYDFLSGTNHTTIPELFTYFINNHNNQVDVSRQFSVGNITVTDPNNYIVRSDATYLNTWDSINQKLIDTNGGYLFVRHEEHGIFVDYVSDFETLSSQKIEFGKNLLDLTKTTKGENIATAIIPLGAKLSNDSEERLTIESVNGVDYVYSQDAVNEYGWIFRTVTWDDVTDASNLLAKANAELANEINLSVSIELNAVDLASIDSDISAFKIGTYITVKTSQHGLNSNFLVTKLSIDLLNPGSNKLTLGKTYSTFTEQTSNQNSSVEQAVKTVEAVSAEYETLQADILLQTASTINQSTTEIMQQVAEDYYFQDDANTLIESINTRFSQTNDEFDFRFNEFQLDLQDVASGADTKFNEINKYIRFVDGNIILGEDGNELTLKIQNDRISFLEGGAEVAYFSNRKLYVLDGEFLNSLTLGNFAFIPRTNGNLSFKKVN